MAFLDDVGLAYFWQKIKDYVDAHSGGGVSGVKGDSESSYRTGQVNLTPSNIGAAASSHSHAISDVTDLQTTLNGKAASSHSHAISDVTDLQTTLNGKAASSHDHAADDITSGTFATARIPNLAASKITSGTIALARGGTATDNTARAINTVFAAPSSGEAGNASWRKLVAADIPNHSTAKLTSGTLGIARGGTGSSGVTSVLDNSTRTVFVWGKVVMVQLHGATGTPSATTVLNSGTLASYKPKYNVSAVVADINGHTARLWVNAENGNISLAAIDYTSSSAWYGTLVYILA